MSCFQRAVATAEKLYGGATTLLLAQTHQALARALRVLDADTPSGSDEHYREAVTALDMAREILPYNHPLLALFRFTLGEGLCGCLSWKTIIPSDFINWCIQHQ